MVKPFRKRLIMMERSIGGEIAKRMIQDYLRATEEVKRAAEAYERDMDDEDDDEDDEEDEYE
jgi:molybdenum-dependent DNA-binding transcriptional regulator ModE